MTQVWPVVILHFFSHSDCLKGGYVNPDLDGIITEEAFIFSWDS